MLAEKVDVADLDGVYIQVMMNQKKNFGLKYKYGPGKKSP